MLAVHNSRGKDSALLVSCLRVLGLSLLVLPVVCIPVNSAHAQYAGHNQGNLQLVTSADGGFGTIKWGLGNSGPSPIFDPITGDSLYGSVYPSTSGLHYLLGAVEFGGVSGRDTLVSWALELIPDMYPYGEIKAETTDPSKTYYSPDAFAELDLTYEYTDTSVSRAPVLSY